MYISSVEIDNVRSIEHLKWEFDEQNLAGWHVLIGDNATGKTTILRAIAFVILGANNQHTPQNQNWFNWIRSGHTQAEIELEILSVNLDKISEDISTQKSFYATIIINGKPNLFTALRYNDEPKSRIWGGGIGWFAASYGAFRRFEGKNPEIASPRYKAHVTLFDETVSLRDVKDWLIYLLNRQNFYQEKTLENIKNFINNANLFPNGLKLDEVTPDDVFLKAKNQVRLRIEELSDGYRSILSVVLDIIQQMISAYDTNDIFENDTVKMPGVVLIDEIDSHLHPSWQQAIGFTLRRIFPNVQFIVTTHSPIICRAVATGGSIFRLVAEDENSGYVISPDSEDFKKLVHGDVIDAYGTELFGEDVAIAPDTVHDLETLSRLKRKMRTQALSPSEQIDYERILATLPQSQIGNPFELGKPL